MHSCIVKTHDKHMDMAEENIFCCSTVLDTDSHIVVEEGKEEREGRGRRGEEGEGWEGGMRREREGNWERREGGGEGGFNNSSFGGCDSESRPLETVTGQNMNMITLL